MIKPLILGLIGEENAGRLDYLLRRKPKSQWGPLNNQIIRQRVYRRVIELMDARAIVETGTYRGTTSEFFAESGLPVYTVEIDSRMYGFAKQRFSNRSDRIHVVSGDSPTFLRNLAKDPGIPKSKVFFYLDAHVQDNSHYFEAPLVEELEIIFHNWTECVVLVDDFEVPGTDYTFDDWGPGRNLSLVDCVYPLDELRLSAFYPAGTAAEDGGAKRGWVVLCREPQVAKVIQGIADLRPALLPWQSTSAAKV